MTAHQIEALKALALAATPGEWKVERLQGGGHHNVGIRVRGPIVSGYAAALNTRWANEAQAAEQEANAAYIAAANPAAVLELIAENQRLLAERDTLDRDCALGAKRINEAADLVERLRAELAAGAARGGDAILRELVELRKLKADYETVPHMHHVWWMRNKLADYEFRWPAAWDRATAYVLGAAVDAAIAANTKEPS